MVEVVLIWVQRMPHTLPPGPTYAVYPAPGPKVCWYWNLVGKVTWCITTLQMIVQHFGFVCVCEIKFIFVYFRPMVRLYFVYTDEDWRRNSWLVASSVQTNFSQLEQSNSIAVRWSDSQMLQYMLTKLEYLFTLYTHEEWFASERYQRLILKFPIGQCRVACATSLPRWHSGTRSHCMARGLCQSRIHSEWAYTPCTFSQLQMRLRRKCTFSFQRMCIW